ncbi:hypothetical protein DYB28_000411 [Aphanomyces astaci]|uniref:Peptidase A2 domain-containing protein n=1 Tax=Aphanomyces astaci TaxID=112090 RepID=A0A9X8E6R5_APHAT|nr:hypothetical protein DYB28_000411 [Aphanomyces astaci]
MPSVCRVAMWDMAYRDYRGVTEAEWAAWFRKAFEEEPQDLEVLKKSLTTAIRTACDRSPFLGDRKAAVAAAVDLPGAPQPPIKTERSGHCPKCAPGESERLLKEQMDKWESARNKKVTKLQGSANTSLGREGKIEGIVYVTTTLLNSGSDVTMLTAGVMKSLERAVVEIKVISPELSVIQPYGQAPALKVDRKVLFKLVTRDTP